MQFWFVSVLPNYFNFAIISKHFFHNFILLTSPCCQFTRNKLSPHLHTTDIPLLSVHTHQIVSTSSYYWHPPAVSSHAPNCLHIFILLTSPCCQFTRTKLSPHFLTTDIPLLSVHTHQVVSTSSYYWHPPSVSSHAPSCLHIHQHWQPKELQHSVAAQCSYFCTISCHQQATAADLLYSVSVSRRFLQLSFSESLSQIQIDDNTAFPSIRPLWVGKLSVGYMSMQNAI